MYMHWAQSQGAVDVCLNKTPPWDFSQPPTCFPCFTFLFCTCFSGPLAFEFIQSGTQGLDLKVIGQTDNWVGNSVPIRDVCVGGREECGGQRGLSCLTKTYFWICPVDSLPALVKAAATLFQILVASGQTNNWSLMKHGIFSVCKGSHKPFFLWF